jgi:hypothetical protein
MYLNKSECELIITDPWFSMQNCCTVMKRVTATHAEIIFLCYINFSDN